MPKASPPFSPSKLVGGCCASATVNAAVRQKGRPKPIERMRKGRPLARPVINMAVGATGGPATVSNMHGTRDTEKGRPESRPKSKEVSGVRTPDTSNTRHEACQQKWRRLSRPLRKCAAVLAPEHIPNGRSGVSRLPPQPKPCPEEPRQSHRWTLSPLFAKRFSPPPECLRSGRLQGLILNAICVPPTRGKVLAAEDAGAMSHDCLTIRATKELPTKSVLLRKCFSCSTRYLSPSFSALFCFSQLPLLARRSVGHTIPMFGISSGWRRCHKQIAAPARSKLVLELRARTLSLPHRP